MKALVLQNPGTLRWADDPEPIPTANEALVRVRRCGVCGTDTHAVEGTQPLFVYPRRLGHELCVEVISAQSRDFLPGDLCAVEPYYFCGSCPACHEGKTNCCELMKVLGVHIDGGLAPLMTIPLHKLHRAQSLSPDQIALIEPLAIGVHAVERAALRTGEPTVILGMGPIGLGAAMFAKAMGANLVCVESRATRLRVACDQMKLGVGMCPGDNLGESLRDHFGQLPSVIIDATGNPASMHSTFELAEHGGRIVFVGLFKGDVSFDDPNFHRRELTLMASRAGRPETFGRVIDAIEDKSVDPLPMITHRFEFFETADRLPLLHREPGLIKAMIDFDSSGVL